VLPDGSYDAIVVDASATEGGATALDLTVLSGPHKGEVVTVRAEGLGLDDHELLAVPATLTVRDGEPSVHLEG
jgi:hypothetical protein